jgi:hypothetical protein
MLLGAEALLEVCSLRPEYQQRSGGLAGGILITYINKDRIWRNQSGVVLEEQSRGYLRNLADNLGALASFLLFALDIGFLVLLQSSISLADYAFDSTELASLLCDTHIEITVVGGVRTCKHTIPFQIL